MRRTRVVIQSRLTSSRLPGKALLTIAGLPLVELVARRASRSGHEVVVATSEERDDAPHRRAPRSVGIAVLRGALDDVLGRFVGARPTSTPADRVVRLTGDNPVADADLVDELLAAVEASGHTYGRVDIDRVPEGLGAEVFSVEALRLAAAARHGGVRPRARHPLAAPGARRAALRPQPACNLDPRRFRCTVDVLADYVRVSGLFTRRPTRSGAVADADGRARHGSSAQPTTGGVPAGARCRCGAVRGHSGSRPAGRRGRRAAAHD